MTVWLRSHEKAVYRTVNACLLVCLVLFGAEGVLGIGKLNGSHFIVAFVVLGILIAANHMTIRGRAFCLTMLSLLACAVVAAGAAGGSDFWKSFFPWLVGQGTAPLEWETWYGLIQTALLAAGCYLLQVLFEKAPRVKTAAAVSFLGILVFCLLTRREPGHTGMAFIVCSLLSAWVEWIQAHWRKKRIGEKGLSARAFWLLPFMALYLALLMIMPAPEEPYDWKWVKTAYHRLQESIHTYAQNIKWGDREGFGMAFTGFSEEGALGGDLREETREVMKVQVRPSGAGYLYLTGMVYDTFDGREWSRRQQEYADAVFLDTVQTLYAVRAYDRRYQSDYLKEVRVNIRYDDFRTGYVFAPLKIWELEEGDSERSFPGGTRGRKPDVVCGDGVLYWNGQKGYGTEYELRYFRMNAGQPQFDTFLEEAGKTGEVNEAVWREIMKEYAGRGGQTFTLQDREDYRKEVYEAYQGDGSLSAAGSGEANLSEELESYLEEILKGTETDVEKLRALEKVLSSYTYTFTPGELPEEVQDAGAFLDYFLLESRQGYCTYFATAFVLLARAEGIPARYVQGYCVPVGEQGEGIVSSNMAHAWPEAYLEGVGWISFEPSPGYGVMRYEPWKLRQPTTEVPEEGTVPEEASVLNQGIGAVEEEVSSEEMADMENLEGTDAESGKGRTFSRRLFCAALSVFLAVCGILFLVGSILGRRRYGHLEPEQRLRAEVFRNLRVLSCLGLERGAGETLEEFSKRAEELRELPLRFTEKYEKVVYGREAVGEVMIKETADEREELLALLKKERKWLWTYCKVRLYLERYRF